MSVSALSPTAPTTLVIVLGASAWPNSPGFQASRAFGHAAHGFRNYLLDPRGFSLPVANLLDLFDAPSSASDQLEQLGSFLDQQSQALKAQNQAARDVLVYFVGHGGFVGPSADFYLLLRRTNASSLRASGMAIDALAEVLREKARQMRRYLFLDCCFAAAAFRAFQGGPDQTAITKTLDAFAVQARSSGFPRRGTVLLCSSDQKSPSLLLPDESCTMFSYALLDVLKNGDLHRLPRLSLRDIKELAEDRLASLPEKNAPRPGLYSPDQSDGDVADVPFFPNPGAQKERIRQIEEERQRQAEIERKRITPNETISPGLSAPGSVQSSKALEEASASPQRVFASSSTLSVQTQPMGTVICSYRQHSASVRSLSWSPDSTQIVSVSGDKMVHVWDAMTGRTLRLYQDIADSVQLVAWYTGSMRLATAGSDAYVRVWDMATNRLLATYQGHSGSIINAIAWSPKQELLASASNDGTIHVWNALTGQSVLIYRGHSGSVYAAVWSLDGKRLVSGSDDTLVQVWEAFTGKPTAIYPGQSSKVLSTAWSPDMQRVACGREDGTVQKWEVATNREVLVYRSIAPISVVAWSPEGRRFAFVSGDNTVQVWDTLTNHRLFIFQHAASVRAMAWSPDGKYIASGGDDAAIHVWIAP